MAWQYGVAQTVAATMYSGGEPTAPTGALTATISKDGAGFGAIAGTVAQIGATPCVLLSLAIADTTCATGVVRIVDAGGAVDDRYVEFCTEADYTAAVAARIDDYITSREASGAAAAAVATLNDLSAADVEDAVWDAATADHTDPGSMGVAGKLVGDNLDAKISTRSTLTAAQVWAAGTRTLTGFGTLVADVATAVWGAVARTITGGTVTTVGDKTGYALTAAYDAAQTAAQATALATVAADVLRTLGLAQENQCIDDVTTDISGRMTSARLRTYSVAGSVGTANDVLATYTITATYTGTEEAPTTYKVVKV